MTNTREIKDKPKLPNFEDIEFLTVIAKKLTEDEANHVLYILNEWSYASGFAKGMIEMCELQKGSYHE